VSNSYISNLNLLLGCPSSLVVFMKGCLILLVPSGLEMLDQLTSMFHHIFDRGGTPKVGSLILSLAIECGIAVIW